ncbi:hypothetical protein H8959_011538 [Pygathrix nigripes]
MRGRKSSGRDSGTSPDRLPCSWQRGRSRRPSGVSCPAGPPASGQGDRARGGRRALGSPGTGPQPAGGSALGFPKSVKSREQLSEYLTVVIFTASAQHAAVNFGQYDWCSWIPNAPPTMRAPPPTAKGVVTIEQIVDTLPDRGRSCWHLGAVWALSQFQENELFLGMYPEEHFIEKPVKEAMARFRKNLEAIVSVIAERNKKKQLPYYYLSPDRIPNSVAI